MRNGRSLFGRDSTLPIEVALARLPRAAYRDEQPSKFVSVAAAAAPGGCAIKGNINARGEHIYHMPGQEYYDRTIITPSKGERWFCSEEEAVAAGWRPSKR